jgi:hypothetical protein
VQAARRCVTPPVRAGSFERDRRSTEQRVESAEHGCSKEEAAASTTRPFPREEADEAITLAT